MKKIYKMPVIEIVEISETDIIKTSGGILNINSLFNSLKITFENVKQGAEQLSK